MFLHGWRIEEERVLHQEQKNEGLNVNAATVEERQREMIGTVRQAGVGWGWRGVDEKDRL